MKVAPHPCPNCGKNLTVEPRGDTAWIAYCRTGTNYGVGCYAEFGETPEEAIALVEQQHDEATL